MDNEIEHKFLDPNIPRKDLVLQEHLDSTVREPRTPPFFSLIEFCPRSNPEVYPNVNEHIPLELYEKIMAQLAEVKYDGVILYSAFGEPLLYKGLEAILEITKRYCPDAKIETVSDGDFVTPAKLRSLFGAGLDTLLISMYDGPEQVEHFKDIISESEVDENKVILRTRWLPAEENYGITLSNRAGMINLPEVNLGKLTEPLKRPCYYPFYQALVDYDGAVLLCPHDWGKKLIAGNLNQQTIHEVWDGPFLRRARRNLANSDRNFAPCDVCDVDGTLIGGNHFKEWLTYYEANETI